MSKRTWIGSLWLALPLLAALLILGFVPPHIVHEVQGEPLPSVNIGWTGEGWERMYTVTVEGQDREYRVLDFQRTDWAAQPIQKPLYRIHWEDTGASHDLLYVVEGSGAQPVYYIHALDQIIYPAQWTLPSLEDIVPIEIVISEEMDTHGMRTIRHRTDDAQLIKEIHPIFRGGVAPVHAYTKKDLDTVYPLMGGMYGVYYVDNTVPGLIRLVVDRYASGDLGWKNPWRHIEDMTDEERAEEYGSLYGMLRIVQADPVKASR